MKRSAPAAWQGGLKDGNGRISTEPGTNPEELIAAAKITMDARLA